MNISIIIFLLGFGFLGCEPQPTNLVPELNAPDQMPRELGTLISYSPVVDSNGNYNVIIRLTKDTVLASLADIQAYASDSLGKEILRSSTEVFYTEDNLCAYSNKKDGCIPFQSLRYINTPIK
jgi:hypothetical protein